MKCFRTAILALLMLMLLPQIALAENEVELSVSTAAASSKGEAVVEVVLAACEGVDSVQFNLNYDPNALSVVRVTPGQVFPAEYCVTNANEPGRIRVACATARGLSDEDRDVLLEVVFKTRGQTGSAVTLSDVLVTVVDSEFIQTKAYLLVENGGVTVGGAALPAPITTPWIAETPVPTPSPEPDPTPEPTPAVLVDDALEEAEPTPAPEPASNKAILPYFIVAVFSVLAAAAIIIILVSSKNSRKRRKRKKKSSAKRRQNP